MSSFWIALLDIIKSVISHVITLNLIGLNQDLGDFLDWWDWLWDLILYRVDAVWTGLTSLGDFVTEALHGVGIRITNLGQEVYAWAVEQIQAAWDLLWAEIVGVYDYAVAAIAKLKAWVEDLFRDILDAAIAVVTPLIDAAKAWVSDTFGWILDSYTLFTEWLAGVKDAVTWLATYAWTSLQSFLSDPLGFVLGLLGATVINMVNWWLEFAEPLSNFLTLDLPDLQELMAQGLTFLQTLVSAPLQTILDLLYPIFLDWFEQLIADNW